MLSRQTLEVIKSVVIFGEISVYLRGSGWIIIGTERQLQDGINGQNTTTYQVTYLKGIESVRELIETTSIAPIPQIIGYGTKEPVITTTEETVTSVIPFSVIYQDNADVFIGEERVIKDEVVGRKATIYKVTLIDGVETSRSVKSETVVLEAIDQIIERGTKQPEAVIEDETVNVVIPFDTQCIETAELAVGQERIIQVVQNGEKVQRYLVTYLSGQEISRTLISETIQLEAINQSVEIGSRVDPASVVPTPPTDSAETPTTPEAPQADEEWPNAEQIENSLNTIVDNVLEGIKSYFAQMDIESLFIRMSRWLIEQIRLLLNI